MEFATQIEVAADIIWIRLHANGDMILRRLRTLLRMEKVLFYQGIGWLAREGKISIAKDGWRTRISLVK
ncbi:MAG: winged helix-turn-helix domain-containing protein [Candidatus Scalindua sp.]